MQIIILLLTLSTPSYAYDGKIKDKYGRVSGYLDKDGDKTYIVNKYGKRGDYIESDGTVKDKYGKVKGKIEEKK
jgi:hypothetical protein